MKNQLIGKVVSDKMQKNGGCLRPKAETAS